MKQTRVQRRCYNLGTVRMISPQDVLERPELIATQSLSQSKHHHGLYTVDETAVQHASIQSHRFIRTTIYRAVTVEVKST